MGAWSRYFAFSQRNRFVVDAVTAGLVGVLVVPIASASDVLVVDGPRIGGAAVAAVSLAMVAAMAWRRTSPVASAAVVYSLALLHIAVGVPLILPTDLLVAWALWSVTVHGPRWASRVALAGALVGSVLVGVLSSTNRLDAAALSLGIALIFLTTWSIALARRARREAMDSLIDRAERLEIERDQQAQLAAADERARIAREMHDIVAHSLTVMIAQADGGRYAAATDPAAATRALGTIAETGRAALTDMRRLLGVLRAGPVEKEGAGDPASSRADSDDDAPTGPLPATDDIGALVDRLRADGLRVSLVRMGSSRILPPGTGLTVYRIAQEALTNVLKHAGPDPQVTVLLHWLPTAVVVEVSDDGRGAATDSDGQGQGLIGMRERAAMFGGQVTAGPRPGGGFRVRASLPTPPSGLGGASTSADVPLAPAVAKQSPAPSPTPAGQPSPPGAPEDQEASP